MKRLTKTFVSLVIITALIMPMLAMLTNTGSVEAAGYRTVIVNNPSEIWSKINSKTEKIASYTTERYYVADYLVYVGIDRVNGYGNLFYGGFTASRTDNGGYAPLYLSNTRIETYGRIKTFKATVSGRINLGWHNVNSSVRAPNVRVNIKAVSYTHLTLPTK